VADAEQLLEWRDGLLVFHDTSLRDAAAEFNRYNRRKIVIADERVAKLRVGGHFRWDNADAFVRLLERGFPVRADVDGERILLRSP
jgi:transmembrane sensor